MSCKKHPEAKRYKRKEGGYRCSKCAMASVIKWRRNKKRQLVEIHGGCCIQCGYKRSLAALCFHHRDPATKEFPLAGRGLTRGWDKMIKEAAKCDLLCANCHAELHSTVA